MHVLKKVSKREREKGKLTLMYLRILCLGGQGIAMICNRYGVAYSSMWTCLCGDCLVITLEVDWEGGVVKPLNFCQFQMFLFDKDL